jgi:hypothetical protein
MKTNLIFTATHYDPDGNLYHLLSKTLPLLQSIFPTITISAHEKTDPRTLELFTKAGVDLRFRVERDPINELPQVGFYRRQALSLALEHQPNHILLADLDRMVHWANYYPGELKNCLNKIQSVDFLVIGRTPRAFKSHPASMTSTESIINTVFKTISHWEWDVVAATRGLSAAAAEHLINFSADDTFGCDASWPLLLKQAGTFSLDYLATEGMEFETGDIHSEEITAIGLQQWLLNLDNKAGTWRSRVKATQIEIEAMLPFTNMSIKQ